jgi:hypothetical protein
MMQPKRQDEIDLYATLRKAHPSPYGVVLSNEVDEAAEKLGIPGKRAFRLVEKWDSQGWYQLSSFPPGGWFTEDAPGHLDACMP